MNRKTLYTIFFIILLLIVLFLKCSVVDDKQIEVIEDTDVVQGTFEELVTSSTTKYGLKIPKNLKVFKLKQIQTMNFSHI